MTLFKRTSKETRLKLESLRVLIVDDQPEMRALVREILSLAGVDKVFEAGHVKDGLDLLDIDGRAVNFVICDWNMPDVPGISFLRQVRAAHPDIPFLMITGRADTGSVMEAKHVGVSAYIRKPFSPKQLEEKINLLIGASQEKDLTA